MTLLYLHGDSSIASNMYLGFTHGRSSGLCRGKRLLPPSAGCAASVEATSRDSYRSSDVWPPLFRLSRLFWWLWSPWLPCGFRPDCLPPLLGLAWSFFVGSSGIILP